MKTEVYCTIEIEGIHRWEECPIEEVYFLKQDHRHRFFIKAFKPVTHSDRDVEFIWLSHEIKQYLFEDYWDESLRSHLFGKMSCEHIAAELIEKFGLSKCEVSEDNENGCIMYAEAAV